MLSYFLQEVCLLLFMTPEDETYKNPETCIHTAVSDMDVFMFKEKSECVWSFGGAVGGAG